jgi:glycosyltransferase involved in cell wall biosynthesis
LRRLAAAGLLDRVRFTGLVPPRDIRGMLCGFDLLIHASLWEGLPRAVVQALLCEVPAVSFDVDGAPEVVRHGETGFLVPINDTQRLADSVLRLASDAELRRSMGREGRLRCLREFGWRDMVGRIDALYARLAAARSRSA